MEYIVISVGKGDTAQSVARKYKATEKSLFLLNGNPMFFEGERLIVAAGAGNVYTVQPFDTISSIADKCNTTADALRRLNGFEKVFLGQTLIIPCENEG